MKIKSELPVHQRRDRRRIDLKVAQARDREAGLHVEIQSIGRHQAAKTEVGAGEAAGPYVEAAFAQPRHQPIKIGDDEIESDPAIGKQNGLWVHGMPADVNAVLQPVQAVDRPGAPNLLEPVIERLLDQIRQAPGFGQVGTVPSTLSNQPQER